MARKKPWEPLKRDQDKAGDVIPLVALEEGWERQRPVGFALTYKDALSMLRKAGYQVISRVGGDHAYYHGNWMITVYGGILHPQRGVLM